MKKTVLNVRNLSLAISLLLTLLVPMLRPQLASAGTNQCTWTGGGGVDEFWSTAANWSCSVGTIPATGYDVIFPYTGSDYWARYDLAPSTVLAGIWFSGNLGDSGCTYTSTFILIDTGETMRLSGDINASSTGACTSYNTINGLGSLILESNSTFYTNDTIGLNVYPTVIDTNGFNLTLDATTASANGFILGDSVSGSGNLTFNGGNTSFYDTYEPAKTNSYTGTTTITNGASVLVDDEPTMFGTSAGATTVEQDSRFTIGSPCTASGTLTITENFNFSATNPTLYPVFESAPGCGLPSVLSYPLDWPATYYLTPGHAVNFTGNLTLNSNVEIAAYAETTTLSGNISGSGYTINAKSGSGGDLVINGGTNNTATSNGTITPSPTSTTYADSVPGNSLFVGAHNIITVTGTRGDVEVISTGVLKGTGTVANVTSFGGTLQPGLSPGVITTGNLSFDSSTTVDIELEGTAAGEFDQFDVTGTVSLGGSTLNTILFNGYVPANIGDSYMIINNDGADAVTGTFSGLSEGAEVSVGAAKFTISYVGGSGNDVVLTASYIPGPPGTGFGVIKSSYFAPIALIVASLFIFSGIYGWKKSILKRVR